MIGRTLARYRILEQVGRGGMGEVYVAEDPDLKRRVALKILPPEMAADPDRRARFKREAQAIAALNHPNIITVHSVEEAEGVHFITMELVEGETLSRKIPRGELQAGELLQIAVPMADALAAAHARGIVHRDVKPDNVMVTREGRVKVLDFGLAKLAERPPEAPGTQLPTATVTQEGRILGTVAYMSPEQAEGKPVDARSDVCSLGALLYEMATGRQPFRGDTTISTITAILRDTPPSLTDLNPGVPRHLGRIVTRCLAKDPERRYQTAKDLRNDLEQLQSEVTSGDHPPRPAAVRSVRGGGRRLLATGIVAGLILAAGLVFWMGRRSGDPERSEGGGASAGASIAVLPFVSIGTDEESLAFSSGLHNDLLTQLSKIDALKVISRTSVIEYRNTAKNLRQIASELGVASILEGSVQRAGNRLRLNAQLIDARNDEHLWAETYDRELTAKDVFEIQGDIARQIAGALQARLTPDEQRQLEVRPTENLEAYERYIRALDFDAPGEEEVNARGALHLMEGAVALDPGFALASAQLGRLHAQIYWMHFDRSAERLRAAKNAIDDAFRADPDLAEAHMAFGYYHYWGHLDYDRALMELEEARRTQPNNTYVLSGIGFVKRRQGKMEEAVSHFRRTAELDPRSVVIAQAIGDTLVLLREYEAADQVYFRALDLNPTAGHTLLGRARIQLLWKGDAEKARQLVDHADELEATVPAMTEFGVAVELCRRDYAGALQRIGAVRTPVVIDNQFAHVPADLLRADVHRLMGERERARELYEAARTSIEERLRTDPEDERLHSALGLALAGLGRKEEAIREGLAGVGLLSYEREAMRGAVRVEELAAIYAMLGEQESAIERLEFLLSRPTLISKPYLRLDPRWDPLRGNPRFARLVGD